MSQTWKTLNKIVNNKRKEKLCHIFKHNNSEISDPQEIANGFSQYFQKVQHNLYDKIPDISLAPCHYMKPPIKDTLFFYPTNETEIISTISNLKNTSSGHA